MRYQMSAGLRIAGSANRGRWLFWIFGASLMVFCSVGVSAVVPPLIISEFRLRGPSDASDEFIEIYNNSDSPHTVATSDGSSGYAVVTSDGAVRHILKNGIVLPARSHYLIVNVIGYSLGSYPASSVTGATGDGTYTADIADNAGTAFFATSNRANFNLANRMDAVGSTSEANTLYKEGAGYPAIAGSSLNYSFYRNLCPITASCSGQPQDTDSNADDFLFVDTNGTSIGAGQRLGASGPENSTSPIRLIPPEPYLAMIYPGLSGCCDPFAAPNFARDLTSNLGNNSTFGTIAIRRKFYNVSGVPLTRLRFRIIDLTTYPAPNGVADLRPLTSSQINLGGVYVQGTTLEQPPVQSNGGGLGSTLSADTITTKTPLASSSNIHLQFLLGVQQPGTFRFAVVIETLPAATSEVFVVSGSTEGMLSTTNDLLISEFRVRGPGGANDEFVEIHNLRHNDHVVGTFDGSAGYALVASDGVVRFTIPNGTVIPGRGHFLGVNSVAYSLASYPAGNGTTATGDVTYTTDIPDNAGLALFRTSASANFVLANRYDAVGSTSEANSLYKEGAGYPALTPSSSSINYSFYRTIPIPTSWGDAGRPKDTDDNAVDFLFVDTNGTSAGAGQRLGAPGPENLSSPINGGCCLIGQTRLDPVQKEDAAPNLVFDPTSDPANHSRYGTLSIRRTIKNQTLAPLTRLRFRVVDLTTFPAPSGVTDLRPITSSDVSVQLTDLSVVAVRGTTLEEWSPTAQLNGGGFNSTMSAGSVSLATPLAIGASVSVQFLLGLENTGCHRLAIFTETLPGALGAGNISSIVTPPTGVVATAITPTSIAVTWASGACSTTFNVYRGDNLDSYGLIGGVVGNVYTDGSVLSGTSHLYKVRPIEATTYADYSEPDLATTVLFADSTLTPDLTPVKAVHITELRTAVNAVRTLAGLGAASFTDPSLVTGMTPSTLHISDLRTALDAARAILGLTVPGYTDPVLTTNVTSIRAVHVEELRNRVK